MACAEDREPSQKALLTRHGPGTRPERPGGWCCQTQEDLEDCGLLVGRHNGQPLLIPQSVDYLEEEGVGEGGWEKQGRSPAYRGHAQAQTWLACLDWRE